MFKLLVFISTLFFSTMVFSSASSSFEERLNSLDTHIGHEYTVMVRSSPSGGKVIFKIDANGNVSSVFKIINNKTGFETAYTDFKIKRIKPTLKRFKSYDVMFTHLGKFTYFRSTRV